MRIDVYSDTICPWCYIGKKRLERALAEQPQNDLTVTWRAFQLNPDMPPEGMNRQRYLELKFGGSAGAQRVYDPIEQTGQDEGIEFAFQDMAWTPNTIDSHRLIRLAGQKGLQTELVQSLFERYFLEAKDIGDIEVLVAAAEAAGLDGEEVRQYLQSDKDIDQVRAEDAHARAIGIQGVPTFVLNNKYVLSGAHAPEVLIRMFELGQQDDEQAEAAENVES